VTELVKLPAPRVPIFAAPMAGGVSTPALVLAMSAAGGLGFLAAGYATLSQVDSQIREVKAGTAEPFGLNIFLPCHEPVDRVAVDRYRGLLQARARELGVKLAEHPEADDDQWRSKLDIAISQRVPVVSFTFGCPPSEAVAALHAAGACAVATVTSVDEALAAQEVGVDALCVQGAEAGGHRGTFVPRRPAADEPGLLDLLAAVKDTVRLPLIAAGGIGTADQVAAVLDAGAIAAQVGTALLRTPESGAHPVHKASLVDGRFTATVVTTAFTGRPARALRNGFVKAFDGQAPFGYPEIHHLTKALRAFAAQSGDADGMSLWAGVNHVDAQAVPVARVIAKMSGERGAARRTSLWEE